MMRRSKDRRRRTGRSRWQIEEGRRKRHDPTGVHLNIPQRRGCRKGLLWNAVKVGEIRSR